MKNMRKARLELCTAQLLHDLAIAKRSFWKLAAVAGGVHEASKILRRELVLARRMRDRCAKCAELERASNGDAQ